MIDPVPHPIPRFLFALDPRSLAGAEPAALARFIDRVCAARPDGVFVLLGDATPAVGGMPQFDYRVSLDGSAILRLPDREAVAGWHPDAKVGAFDALSYLSQALLIPTSSVYAVISADLAPERDLDARVVAVGGASAPDDARWVPESHPVAIVDALDELGLFARSLAQDDDICDEGFRRALDSLHRCVTPIGFTAASLADNPLSAHDANYAAVWGRDGVMTGLWCLCLGDEVLTHCFRRTLALLARHQAPSGQIPANVRLEGETPDYSGIGGIAAVDSVIWFVIGAVRYAFHVGDAAFAERMRPHADAAMTWLLAHDSNSDGLLEIPESSDWMDLFPRSYNVMLEQVLWSQSCADYAALLEAQGDDGSPWLHRADHVNERILQLFWPDGRQLVELAGSSSGQFAIGEASYLLSQVTPFDYGWRCDVFGNLLAALTGLLDEARQERLFRFLWGVGVNTPFPVACLYPPITSGADDWKDYFIVNFLNLPDHYHNGGIWPFIGGLWVRFLAHSGHEELAHRELASLAEACRGGLAGEWEFNEWLHGRTGRPMGKLHQAWSAASFAHAYLSVHRRSEPTVFAPLDPAQLRRVDPSR